MSPRWVTVLVTGALALSTLSFTPAAVAADAGPRPEVTTVEPLGMSAPLSSLADPQQLAPMTTRPAPTLRKKSPNERLQQIIENGPGPTISPEAPLPGLDMPGVLSQWEGINNLNGVYPPDTVGDVGPNHYVQMVNLSLQIFAKNGTSVYGPVDSNALWSGTGTDCATTNDGDPIVLYDQLAQRWLITQFSIPDPVTFAAPFYECVAISTSSDPTGSYYRYAFEYQDLPDYPKIGVWPNAYFASYNMFAAGSLNFAGQRMCAWDRAAMLTGSTVTELCYELDQQFGMLPADVDGSTPPPAGSPGYFLGLHWTDNDKLTMFKMKPDFGTPANTTLTGPISVPVNPFTFACVNVPRSLCIPQPGTAQKLDSLGDRMMYRLAYRNFGDHESLVTNNTVAMDGTLGQTTQTGIQFVELRDLAAATPTVHQQGVSADVDGLTYRWMGSVAMDKSGNMALGYSTAKASGTNAFPSIRYTGRRNTDPLNQMPQAESTIINGSGVQTGSVGRWGDYSSMNVDPLDDCTFWYTTEYVQTTGAVTWQTRIASFRYPSCGQEPAAPTSVTASRGNASVAVAFAASTAPAGFPVQKYTVTASPGGMQCTTQVGSTADPLTCIVPGLTNGQPYTFTVVAANEAGNSPVSPATQPVVPATTPSAPTGVSAVVSSQVNSVDVTWLAPDSGGSPITGYTVTASPGGATCSTPALGCTVAGLSPGGTYTLSVVASNALGNSAPGVSAPVSLAKASQTASVKLPKKIAYKGKTTLLKKAVVTSAGNKAAVKVVVKPKGKKYAKVSKKKNGKVVIATKGKRKLKVVLTLSASATAQANPYLLVKKWTVKPPKK